MTNTTKTPAKVTPSKIAGVQKLARTQKFEAIEFTGKNGKDVVAFAGKYGAEGRAGGGWVKIFNVFANDSAAIIRKGDVLVVDLQTKSVEAILTAEQVANRYTKTK